MIKDLPPPTEAEEYRNTAEILRDMAAQARFGRTRIELFNYADNLDRLASLPEPRSQVTSERFAPLSDGSVRTDADAAEPQCRASRPPSRAGAANFRHFRVAALAGADVSASA
jgi:hypothetical protein